MEAIATSINHACARETNESNLHKHCWSVKALQGENKGRVIHHLNEIVLRDAIFKVYQSGRERVLREQRKNVHAGVVGYVEQWHVDGGDRIDEANIVYMINKKVYVNNIGDK